MPDERIGDYLRRRRDEAGLSITQVVLKTKGAIGASTLSKVETGKRPATPELLVALLPTLEIPATEWIYVYKLAGLWPDGGEVSEPAPPRQFTEREALELISRVIDQLTNIDAPQKAGVKAKLRPVAEALLEQASRERRPRRVRTRKAG